jgi:hypothetical protein
MIVFPGSETAGLIEVIVAENPTMEISENKKRINVFFIIIGLIIS